MALPFNPIAIGATKSADAPPSPRAAAIGAGASIWAQSKR